MSINGPILLFCTLFYLIKPEIREFSGRRSNVANNMIKHIVIVYDTVSLKIPGNTFDIGVKVYMKNGNVLYTK